MLSSFLNPLRQHLGYRIATVASIPALIFIAILGGYTYGQAYSYTYDQLFSSIDLQADADARRMEDIVNSIELTIKTLSENSTIANGLVDSAGRETYLNPLLEGFSVINGIQVDLVLTDFLGEIISASGDGYRFNGLKDIILSSIERGKEIHKIIQIDGERYFMGIEVLIYSRTGSGEGALVYLINLDKLYTQFSLQHRQYKTMLVQIENKKGVSADSQLQVLQTPDSIEMIRPIEMVTNFVGPKLAIKTIALKSEVFKPLKDLTQMFVFSAFVAIAVVIFLSIWLGLQAVKPMLRLRNEIQNSVPQDELDLGPLLTRQDEIGSLARSFNDVFRQLKDMNMHLEQNVEKRTEEYQKAKEEADRANLAKSEFLSSMSHELRTPLNAILGFAQLLQLTPNEPLSDGQSSATNQIIKGGKHLLNLINDVLNLSQIETGQLELNIETFDSQSVMEDCAHMIEAMPNPLGVTLDTTKFKNATLKADKVKFTQVLYNLLSNALKYNREGGTISVTTKITDDRMQRILIKDTGVGISKSDYKNLFKPFSRLGAENSKIEGTGIGLSITKRLLESMHGRIGVNGTLGIGSEFWVDIPFGDKQ